MHSTASAARADCTRTRGAGRDEPRNPRQKRTHRPVRRPGRTVVEQRADAATPAETQENGGPLS